MPVPIHLTADGIDLGPRFFSSTTVVASPSAAAETTVGSLTLTGDIAATKGVFVFGMAAYTVGTSGTAVTLKIRRTDTSGATQVTSGALTKTAANLYCDDVQAFDSGPTLPGQVYVLTMTVTAGAATSTVSAVQMFAIVV